MALGNAPVPFVAEATQRCDVFSGAPAGVGASATATQFFSAGTLSTLDPVAHQFIDVGQNVWVGPNLSTQTAGIIVSQAWCASAGVLAVNFINNTGTSALPVAGQYSYVVW